ncbi:hypothetical protein B0H34DRAFT_718897 [Crassisporium funariophilum]|nr:hypothetical protein B0H34DRAFT_718897 [Crassisporium funariophilum]
MGRSPRDLSKLVCSHLEDLEIICMMPGRMVEDMVHHEQEIVHRVIGEQDATAEGRRKGKR